MSDYRPDHLARLEPTYMTKHHMQSAPFAADHDDRFLYLDSARNERLALLNHMTQFSNLLLIVMGAAGIGKTSLLQRFVLTAQVDWRVCEITANTMMDAEQLLFAAAQGYGLQQLPNDAAQLQEMLYARLATLHRQEQIPILIVHHAHTLPKEALIAVFNLADAQVDQGNLIRIILSCEPQIEKILQAKDVRPLRERVTHTMEIPALDEASTAEYLKHRMAVAGFDGISPFTPKVVKKIFKVSHGVPARINELAHQILEHGDNPAQLDEEMPVTETGKRSHKSMVFITLAAVMAVIVFVYQDQINALLEDKVVVATPTQTPVAAPASTNEVTQQKVISLEPASTPPTVSVPVKGIPTNTPTVPTTVTSSPASLPTAPADSGAIPPAVTIDVRSLDPASLQLSSKTQSLSILGQGFTPESKVSVSWGGHEKMLKADQVKFISENELRISITTGSKAEKWAVQVTDPQYGKSKKLEFDVGVVKPATTTTPAMVVPAIEKAAGIHDAVWIKQQAAQNFTLQLFSTRTQHAAVAFIQQNKLHGDLAIFHSSKQGGDWYSVVMGSYATQQAAQQASKQLPTAIQKAKPWVRRFDAISVEIKPEKLTMTKPVTTATGPAPKQTGKPAQTPAGLPGTAANPALTQHEAWLWSQDPRHYTLQLLVSQHSDSVERFINQHDLLRAKAVYFRTHKNSRELYTVVYGVYATQQQAEDASAHLPAELKAVKPHVRTLGSIHAELDRAAKPVR